MQAPYEGDRKLVSGIYMRLSLQEASSAFNCAAYAAQVAGSLNRQAAEPGTFTLFDKIGQSTAISWPLSLFEIYQRTEHVLALDQ
jgi:hypothetical protein